jgi:hypothetical protein
VTTATFPTSPALFLSADMIGVTSPREPTSVKRTCEKHVVSDDEYRTLFAGEGTPGVLFVVDYVPVPGLPIRRWSGVRRVA